MKKISLFFVIFCFSNSLCFGAEPTEYEVMAKAFSRSTQVFQKLIESGPGYNVVSHRDPMEPLIDGQGNIVATTVTTPVSSHEDLVVKGIVYSDKFKAALIDDKLYFPGDIVGPYRILQIKPDGFLAQDGGKTIFVPLYSNTEAQEKPIARSTN